MQTSNTRLSDPMSGFATFFPRGQALRASALTKVAPTPRATVAKDGSANLYRFTRTGSATVEAKGRVAPPVLLVPSLINRWYVLDLCPGSSMVEALLAAGLDVWCIDWGQPQPEDRHLCWNDVISRILRLSRVVLRRSGAQKLSMLGYCMGATVSTIAASFLGDALHRYVNLAGPIDFRHAGTLGTFVDSRWFDAAAVAAASNVQPQQMQSGFVALDPGSVRRRWVVAAKKLANATDEAGFTRWTALDAWAADNVAFPAAAYKTYIQSMYQRNELAAGTHVVSQGPVDLRTIQCPVLCVTAERDAICPPEAAAALLELVGSNDVEQVSLPGGHVGAVVGGRAASMLYPKLADFFTT